MPCCGGKRKSLNLRSKVLVEFKGDKPVTFVGGITGNKYKFDMKHSKLLIDPRDSNVLKDSRISQVLK